jgi:Tol biopolymer transport system component
MGRRASLSFTAGLLLATSTFAAVGGGATPAEAAVSASHRVNVRADGHPARVVSTAPAISGDGNLIAYMTRARALLPGEPRKYQLQVWLRDVSTGAATLVSHGPRGFPARGGHLGWGATLAISADGGTVAYSSSARNIVPNDTNGIADVFAYDVATDTNVLVSHGPDGEPADGRSDTPALSADGRYVAFISQAFNLVHGGGSEWAHAYLHDLATDSTLRVDRAADGGFLDEPISTVAISGDGQHVGFSTNASNVVTDDDNQASDVFEVDLPSDSTELISHGEHGEVGDDDSGDPSLSFDGNVVAFSSTAQNLDADAPLDAYADVYVADGATGDVTVATYAIGGASAGNDSYNAVLSSAGDVVAFQSYSDLLVDGPPNGYLDVFVRDLAAATTSLASVGLDGAPANFHSWDAALSADGGHLAYTSSASNLVHHDVNEKLEVFRADLR